MNDSLSRFLRESGKPRWRRKKVRVPMVLQMEAVECGAASLSMILAYHGRRVPLEELRVACGVTRDGSKASNMLMAAREYGLVARGFKREPRELTFFPLPMIIHWEFNHFVVLTGRKGNRYYFNDPAMGPRMVGADEFDRSFTGIVLTFERGKDFRRAGRAPNLLLSLLPRLKHCKLLSLYLVLAGALLIVPHTVRPILSRVFYDQVLTDGHMDWVPSVVSVLLATALFAAVLGLLRGLVLLRMELQLGLTTAITFMHHLFRLPMDFFQQRNPGDIQNRISLNDRVVSLLSGGITVNFINLLMIAFYGLILIQYDWILTLAGLLVCMLNILALEYSGRIRTLLTMNMMQAQGKFMGSMMNGLRLMETLRSTGTESDYLATLFGHQAHLINCGQKTSRLSILFSLAPSVFNGLNHVLILTFGALQIMNGYLTIGMLVAFRLLMGSFLGPINNLVGFGAQIQQLKGDLVRLDDVLACRRDEMFVNPPPVPPDMRTGKLEGMVELRNVTFGYSRLGAPLLKDLNIKIDPGRRVAVVGATGSGKTTVARLVAGLHQPWEGEVLLDGRPRGDYPREVLSNSVAYVDQDIFLFDGTARRNLSMWNDSFDESFLTKAAKDAAIHYDIAARPAGYDCVVEEDGRNFSGGQRQRLEIARALAMDPVVLIMDEATSSLDPATELEIDTNIRRRGTTCLIIAHRLSTIRDCDEIIVLDKGAIVQRGTHERLMAEGGEYEELIKMA